MKLFQAKVLFFNSKGIILTEHGPFLAQNETFPKKDFIQLKRDPFNQAYNVFQR
jgi:hypothetical protein